MKKNTGKDTSEKMKELDKRLKKPDNPPWVPKVKTDDESVEFYCRICAGQKYRKVTESNGVLGPGGWTTTLYYVCSNCSVLFQDPEKFSR